MNIRFYIKQYHINKENQTKDNIVKARKQYQISKSKISKENLYLTIKNMFFRNLFKL